MWEISFKTRSKLWCISKKGGYLEEWIHEEL
jgi:hypothetical protein